MNTRLRLQLFLMLAVAMAVTGCYDRMFSPVICNSYSHAIAVQCVFDGDKIATVTLPPKSSMPQREDGLILQALTISMPDGSRLANYTATDFKTRTPAGEKGQFWLVSTNGLTHLSMDDFKAWNSPSLRR